MKKKKIKMYEWQYEKICKLPTKYKQAKMWRAVLNMIFYGIEPQGLNCNEKRVFNEITSNKKNKYGRSEIQ